VSTPTDDAVPTRPGPQAADDGGGGDVLSTLAALAMLGAAIIHFAFAPDHLSEQISHGVFFLVAGWAQLLGAAALGFGWRPRRAWLFGTAAFNAGVAGLWLLSRTAGLPGEEPEAVGFPDSLATGLEVFAAVAALALALGWVALPAERRPRFGLTAVPMVALVAVVSASVIPALGGGHAHGEGGHDEHGHGTGEGETAAGHDGHGHDGAAAESTDDFATRRIAALTGYLPQSELDRVRQINRDYLAAQIRTRSRLLAGLPEAEREARIDSFTEWTVNNALESENGAVAEEGDQPTMHSHGPSVWQDLDNSADVLKLQGELQQGGTVIAAMPTAADAVAAGYFQVTPYVPGIGAHYLNVGRLMDGTFKPGEPEMLLYNGNQPTSVLVGLSYAVIGDDPPAGFTGPNDVWHVHPSLCILGGLVVGPDHTPQELCDSIGAEKGRAFGNDMWMAHLWQVPGWESPWGLFSGENPALNLATSDVGRS
jgi:hypothetical protein